MAFHLRRQAGSDADAMSRVPMDGPACALTRGPAQ
jgi:hypothetical protein